MIDSNLRDKHLAKHLEQLEAVFRPGSARLSPVLAALLRLRDLARGSNSPPR